MKRKPPELKKNKKQCEGRRTFRRRHKEVTLKQTGH